MVLALLLDILRCLRPSICSNGLLNLDGDMVCMELRFLWLTPLLFPVATAVDANAYVSVSGENVVLSRVKHYRSLGDSKSDDC